MPIKRATIETVKKPLDVIYVIDTSCSMQGDKLQTVNKAMKALENEFRNEARKNPYAEINIRILTFGGTNAKWHLKEKTNVNDFKYEDILVADGVTPMADAFEKLTNVLDTNSYDQRSLRPIIVLLSDGEPTDGRGYTSNTYKKSLKKLLELPWGRKATKVAIAIGKEADKDVLAEFTTDKNRVLEANNATQITEFIKWTSTLVTHNSQHPDDDDLLTPLVMPIQNSVHNSQHNSVHFDDENAFV